MGPQSASTSTAPSSATNAASATNTTTPPSSKSKAYSKEDAQFYLGKKVAYITKVSTNGGKNGSKFRVNWGKVCRAHGSNGVVKCKFARDLPPASIGGRVRVMLYPSNI